MLTPTNPDYLDADYVPSPSGMDWTRNTFKCLKIGGVWGFPNGISIWQRTGEEEVTLLAGMLDDTDERPEVPGMEGPPEEVYPDIGRNNNRVIANIEAIGWTLVDKRSQSSG